jgi:hypothetical protein
MVLVAFAACGDSEQTGGSNTGGSNTGAANAGAGGAGGANTGASGGGGANEGGASTEEACEAAIADILAKVDRCDIEPMGGGAVGGGSFGGGNAGGGNSTAECTKEDLPTIECARDCYVAAPCGALDGTDEEAQADFTDCIVACK